MKKILLILVVFFLLTGCLKTNQTFEDNIVINNNSIVILKEDDNISLLLKQENNYILFNLTNIKNILQLSKITDAVDYLIQRENYFSTINYNYKYILKDKIKINEIEFIKSKLLMIKIANETFCIYDQKETLTQNAKECSYILLLNYNNKTNLIINDNTKLIIYNQSHEINNIFLESIYAKWIDLYGISDKEITIITFDENNYRLETIPEKYLNN